MALWAEVLRKGMGLDSGVVRVWSMLRGFQVQEFLRKEVITLRVSEGGSQNMDTK